MTDVVERARTALEPDARMDAYYYGFNRTGVGAVDAVLSAVATAGKAYHHTDEWGESRTWDDDGPTHESRIQAAANTAAALVSDLVAEIERKSAQLAEWRAQYDAIAAELERLRQQRVIETVEQLKQCPRGTVVLAADDRPFRRWPAEDGQDHWAAGEIALPARLLWLPEWSNA